MLGYHPFLRGYHWTRNATPQILIFPNEINELGGLTGGVNVRCVFTRNNAEYEVYCTYDLDYMHDIFDKKLKVPENGDSFIQAKLAD